MHAILPFPGQFYAYFPIYQRKVHTQGDLGSRCGRGPNLQQPGSLHNHMEQSPPYSLQLDCA